MHGYVEGHNWRSCKDYLGPDFGRLDVHTKVFRYYFVGNGKTSKVSEQCNFMVRPIFWRENFEDELENGERK